jgi:hypothetical protein
LWAAVAAAALCLGVVVFVAMRNGGTNEADTTGTVGSTAETAVSGRTSAGDLQPLNGRWRRPDGGYLLEIQKADTVGRMEVRYFNPRPIHVSWSEAYLDHGVPTIVVELRDKGYPGATYRLAHSPKRNALVGLYHQPAVGQTFEVVFVREP